MTDFELYPWQLEPKLAPAVWGGDRLVRDYGKRGDPTDDLRSRCKNIKPFSSRLHPDPARCAALKRAHHFFS